MLLCKRLLLSNANYYYCTTKLTASLLLLSLVALLSFGPRVSLGECTNAADEQQQFLMEMNWLRIGGSKESAHSAAESAAAAAATAGTSESDSQHRAQSFIHQRLRERLEGNDIYLSWKTRWPNSGDHTVGPTQNPLTDIELLPTNVTIVAKVPGSTKKLDNNLLRTLGNFVDCSLGCNRSFVGTSKQYHFWPAQELASIRLDHSFSLLAPVKIESLDFDRANHGNQCNICKLVQSSYRSSFSESVGGFFDGAHKALVGALSILEPHHWLILVVSIWLTTCLIIACLIQRRDRRSMRLYLEERAAYSFTTKR